MKISKWMLALFLLAAFTVAPTHAFAAQPAGGEYGYDPIPEAGNNNGNNGGSGNPTGNGGGGSDGSTYTAPATTAPTTTVPTDLEGKLGVSGGDDKKSKNEKDKSDKSKKSKDGKDYDEKVSGTLAKANPPSDGDSGGSSSLPLIVMLVLATGVIAGAVYWRSKGTNGSNGGMYARFAALAVVVVALVVVGAGKAFAAEKPASTSAVAPSNFMGMMSVETFDEVDAQRMSAGGVDLYRFPVSWNSLQPSDSHQLDWSSIDHFMRIAAEADLKVLPILLGTPKGFANKTTIVPVENAKQIQGWKDFLRGAVRRYGPNGEFWAENPEVPKDPIRTWQIWNEVNFHYFTTPVSPSRYVKLLKISRRILDAEDPKAKIMLSGLYGSPPEVKRKAMKSYNYLDKLYKLKGDRYFDSVAIHPYTPSTSQLKLLMLKVRNTLNRHGDRSMPIHVTEIGWGSDSKTVFGMGTPAKQAKQLTSGVKLLLKMRHQLKIRSMYWFSWQDVPYTTVTCNFCYSSGLFKPGQPLKPKPAWNAFVKLSGGRR